MKSFIFKCKKIYKQLFLYPSSNISSGNVDYDAYWDEKRGEKLGFLSHWQKQRANIVIRFIEKNSKPTILDVGCGDGAMLKYIKERTEAIAMIGVDVSESALMKAKEFGVETVHADIGSLNDFRIIPEADYVLLFEILEHVQSSESFLNHMMEKAKKGVFFSFPNTGFYVHRLRLFFGKFPLQWHVYPGEHIRFWTYSDLRWWLKALGYDTYEIISYEGVPILNRLWPSLFAAGFLVYIQKNNKS